MKKPDFLTLYVNPAWRREGVHSPLMCPFWGNPLEDTHLFAKELYDHFSYDTRHYAVTDDLSKADMVFPPYRQAWLNRHDKALLQECIDTAAHANLPLLVDGVADGEQPLNIENAFVLRIGGYRFVDKDFPSETLPLDSRYDISHRIEIPAQADDLLERCCGGRWEPRAKTDAPPVVGFAGMTRVPLKEMMRRLLREAPLFLRGVRDARYHSLHKGIFWRSLCIFLLRHSSKVRGNFLARPYYSASARDAKKDLKVLQRELVDTILGSDYALDVRGEANASVRLYEILSLGRIPVIIDTERILPFKDEVDWSEFSLMVDHKDIRRLPRIIAEFHRRLTPEQFEAMQRKARDAYARHFRVDAQMPHIVREIAKML